MVENSYGVYQSSINQKKNPKSVSKKHNTITVDDDTVDYVTIKMKKFFWIIPNSPIAAIVLFLTFTCVSIIIAILSVYFGSLNRLGKICIPVYKATMQTSNDYNSGSRYIAAGYLNNDEYLDIVVANSEGNNIGVMLGYGEGLFSPQVTYPTGNSSLPWSLVLADFNKDNQLDIAVANFGRNNILIYHGNGNGTFQYQMSLSTNSSRPRSIAIADFDNDKQLDIVIANYGTDNIGVMFGISNSNFTSQITYSTGFDSDPHSITTNDFNNDGLTDIAVVNFGTNNIGIFFGIGHRNFTFQHMYSTRLGSRPYFIYTADVNNDKKMDLIVANSGTNDIGIFLNYGNGTFHTQTTYSTGNLSVPHSVTVADFNMDGIKDIVVVNFGTDNIVVLFGYGNGSFSNPIPYSTGLNSGAQFVIIGDFNNDNRTDIAVANNVSDNIAVFINDKNIDFRNPQPYSIDFEPDSMTTGDFNKDGRLDIVFTNPNNDSVAILLGYGNGTFRTDKIYPANSRPQSVVVYDFNNDDRLDIAVTSSYTNSISILLSYDNESFADPKTYPTDSEVSSMAFADVNKDGSLDIVCSHNYTNNIGILLGYGNGSFGIEKKYATDSGPESVGVGDFNNDGYLDIVVANSVANNVGVLLGYGNGSFEKQTTYFTGERSYPKSVSVGDVNNDHRSDFIIARYWRDSVTLFIADANGNFPTQKKLWTGVQSSPISVVLGDLNSDNKLDIIIANFNTKDISIFRGNGDGNFADRVGYTFVDQFSPQIISIGDFTNDARLDIAVMYPGVRKIEILSGYDAGKFNTLKDSSTSYGTLPSSLIIGDFNHDNQLDLGVSNYGSNNLAIFIGYGNGKFTHNSSYSTGYNSHPQMIVTNDMNNDKILDILVVNVDSGSLGIFKGYGNGSFQNQITYSTGPNTQPYSLSVANFNNDSRQDIVVANFLADNIGIMLGYDLPLFSGITIYQSADGHAVNNIIIKDFNNDYISDIIFITNQSNIIFLLIGYGNGTFQDPKIYSTNSTISFIAVGDFNNDKQWDIVVTHKNQSNIGILLGYNNGSFTEEDLYTTISQPESVAVGDFNNDDRFDIVVTHPNANFFSVFLAHNDGTFSHPIMFPTDYGASYLAIADFNNDNKLDIAMAHYSRNKTGILFGHGNGSFTIEDIYPTSSGPTCIGIGDFNGDGRLDIVLTYSGTKYASILFGNENGTLANQMDFFCLGEFLSVGDLNNDSRLDFAVSISYYNYVELYFGYGNGTFALANSFSYDLFFDPKFVAVADLNMDNRLDIAVFDIYRLYAHLGSPNEGYLKTVFYSTGSGSIPRSVSVGDFNNDNRPDIVVANSGSNSIGIFTGLGYGDFAFKMTYSTGNGSTPYFVVVNDFNNDNLTDIGVANYGSGNIGIFLGLSNGSFTSQKTYFTEQSSYPYSIAVGDIDKDTQMDLVVAYFGLSRVAILFGVGDGSFMSKKEILTGYNAGPVFVALAQIDNDNLLDIAVANYRGGNIQVFSKMC